MHMAAAMGTPVVAIFGPSGDREWGPWGEGHRVVASTTYPCRPCGMAGCNDSKVSDCLTTLPVAAVLSACEELLA
jgi:heptosyltransferase-3